MVKKTAKENYRILWNHSLRIEQFTGISHLLEWDQEIFMPEDSALHRANQLKLLAGMIHDEKVSPKFADILFGMISKKTGAILASDLSAREKIALREWRRDYLIETALPTRFVEECAKLYSQSMIAWRNARKNDDFEAFSPFLKKIIDANRKKADYIGYEQHPYDALIDLYEPGMTTKTVAALFTKLKKPIKGLVKKIGKEPQVDTKKLHCLIPEGKQLEFSKRLLSKIGFSLKNGRLDISTHPFSTGNHPTDSRITTRIDPNYIFSCLSSVLHEAGHSLYTMGLPVKEYGTPLGQAISMGVHESQSRFWETRIGLSLPFVQFLLPILQKEFAPHFKGVTPNYCYQALNIVKPSFIRVEADEVTYPLHVILRFELEKALMEGDLRVEELPEAWNSKSKELLGITPENDTVGCLQDIHWSLGAIGYFPSYVLGNMYAASIFTRFEKDHPDWKTRVAKGDFPFIKTFLHEHVYKYGRQYRSLELIKQITNEPFSADPYVNYLEEKYSEIYPSING